MAAPDIGWKQRFQKFKNALAQLDEAEELSQQRRLSRLENHGSVHIFEFTFELAWTTLRDFLNSKGAQGLFGSKDTAREAFKLQLITDDEGWTMMLNDITAAVKPKFSSGSAIIHPANGSRVWPITGGTRAQSGHGYARQFLPQSLRCTCAE